MREALRLTGSLSLVPASAAVAAVRRFQPEARVQVIPPAVRPGFYRPPTQAQARAQLGVPSAERCVLLMSGAWGLGPVAAAAEALGDAGVHVLAVARHHARLEARPPRAPRRQTRRAPFGLSHGIPALMAASDLVVSSSGDTCSEALIGGRPL